MKSTTKKIIVLIILGMSFVFLPNIKLDLDHIQKNNVEKPRTSDTYVFKWIDDTLTDNGTNYGNWTWARSQPWCTAGDGTPDDPYIIEDSTFLPTGPEECLAIQHSRKHFVVRNCVFKHIPSGVLPGLRLNNVTNANIIGNQLYNNSYGIRCLNVNNSQFINNNCSNNTIYGIYLDDCYYNTISGNIGNDNSYGVYLNIKCDFNTISGNTVNNNTNYGIYLDGGEYNNITGNTVNDNSHGLYFDGLCDYNTISGNTANNNTENGIYLRNECNNNTISGNTVNDNIQYGIYLDDNCNNNTISGNTVNDNANYGIFVGYNCNNNTISGNTANGNEYGIYLWDHSHNNTISGNTAKGNDYGISIDDYCNNNTISENTANNNTNYGISLEFHCNNNTISGNSANGNDYGIYFFDFCDYNTYTENILYNNTVGIDIDSNDCNNNSLYKNFFLENGKHAEDNGTDNKWNSTTFGNYWDNHTGPDVNVDGIVDIQYNISGSAGGIDYLPIAEDGAPSITINSPSDDGVFGSNAPNYDVTINDDYLFQMWYTLDGGLHNYTFTEFTGTIEQAAWDALSDGAILLTFYASDVPGNIESADVNIVKDTTAPIIVIISPADDEEFGINAPAFSITITDDHLDSIWYTLDGGLTYLITTNASIDQTAWAALSEGLITITFYANDTLGNEAFEDVILTKSIPPAGEDPTIVIVIIVVSIVGGVAVIAGVYLFMKKRA